MCLESLIQLQKRMGERGGRERGATCQGSKLLVNADDGLCSVSSSAGLGVGGCRAPQDSWFSSASGAELLRKSCCCVILREWI